MSAMISSLKKLER
jgi:glutathionylspermidine synthase